MTEKEITKAIRQLLKNLGVFHWKQLGTLGMPKGIPDIIGIWKGQFLGIEVKKPGGRLSPDQALMINRIMAEGGIAFIATSVDDVIDNLGIGDRFLFQREKQHETA